MQVGDTVTFRGSYSEFEVVAFTLDHLGLYLRDEHGFLQARVDEVEVVERSGDDGVQDRGSVAGD